MPVRRLCEVKMKNLLVALAIAAFTGQARAFSGNELLAEARADEKSRVQDVTLIEAYRSGSWAGFVQGVSWTLNDIDPKVCLPKNSTVGQSAAVVKQYLEQNPAQLHRPAQVLAREALQRAFPCR